MTVGRIAHGGRRFVILSEAVTDFRTTRELARATARRVPQPEADPALNHVRTGLACERLRRAKLLDKTPFGWRTTCAGLERLAAPEPRP